MRINITLKKQVGFLLRISSLFLVMLAFNFTTKAQTYINGNLGTGAVSKAGVAAPAGILWHEMQNNIGDNTTANTSLAFNASGTFHLSDNFTVPVGETWTITGASFYTIQVTASPVTAVGVVIRNGSPLAGGTVVYGNLATNVFSSTAAAGVRVITSSANPTTAPWAGTPLDVSEVKTTFSTVLTAGTYWINWQITSTNPHFNVFSQVAGARSQPSYNSVINNAGTWGPLTDAGTPAGSPPVPMDLCFKINYTATGATACATPAPGNTVSSLASVCPGLPFNLSLQNATAGAGVSYQWQTATTAAGPWTNIVGATSATLGYSLAAATFYRCNVTCGTNTVASNPLVVNVAANCYCANTATDPDDEDIFNVTIGTLNNSSTCATTAPGIGSVQNLYSNYTSGAGAPAAPNLIQGAGNPISIQVGTCTGNWGNMVAVWIDLNQDGNFQHPAERVFISPASVTGPNTQTGNVVIPATALLGPTRMRVQVREFGTAANMVPCGTFAWGEVEDYNVNIVPCIPISITTQPANATATCGTNTSLTVATTGSLPTYQWQYRVSATGAWINVTNVAPYSGATTATLNITNVGPTLNGYQYRVLYGGACTSPDVSNFGTLTVAPIVATATPVSAVLCQGGVQKLTITNIASPSPGSVTVNSTFTTPIAIPDAPAGSTLPYPAAVLAGITNTLPVTVPAGATVTGVSVRVSGTHPYFGDLVMSLKTPSTGTINLDYFLNQTGGGVSTAFTNTVITSNDAAAALSTGTAAGNYTGTFRADKVGATGTTGFGNQPGGPTSLLPTTTTWTGALGALPTTSAAATGNWTIGMYDGGATDQGFLNNWSITVNYVLGAPATGVFTGAAGTMFTDAACTIPYTGTALNAIWVKPTTAGVNNYNVVVTDAACSSLPLTIPVTMYAPVGGTATLSNATICENGATSFTLGGALTGGPLFNHQYQVKTSATAAWANVSNGGVYSGATTSTLSLTNVPVSYNGYQYRDSISTGNGCGSLLSTVGTLRVNTNPVVTISAAPITSLFPGLTSTLTAAVSSATAPITYQWKREGSNVLGATTNRTVVGIDALGTYTIAVSDANGCTSSGVSTPASIAIVDSVTTNKLFIYPSPNSGRFEVRYYNGGKAASVVNVYDEKGSLVLSKPFGANTAYQAMNVDITGFGKGIYRVDVLSSNGSRINTGSVLVY
jgi:subtilisin-like proprotein convertase family protein